MKDMCCERMEDALKYGLLQEVDGETRFPARALTEVNPDATAGNVLTGETYDPADYGLTMALDYCPWCCCPLERIDEDDDDDWDEDDWMNEPPRRPTVDTRPL